MITIKIELLTLKMVRTEIELLVKNPINSAYVAKDILKAYIGDSDREHMVMLLLDTKNNVNAIHTVSIGTLHSAMVHPREVFKAAILNNANSIILGHNHPSSDVIPSDDDLELTRRMVEAGKIMGIRILDHIIVSDKEKFYSFGDKGLL